MNLICVSVLGAVPALSSIQAWLWQNGQTLLALLLVLAAAFWLWQRRRPVPDEPSCGRCGYIVRGISSVTCPECGSDLRKVSIRPPGRRSMSLHGWCLLWTTVLPMPALLLPDLLQSILGPYTYYATVSRTIDWHDARTPVQLTIRFDGNRTRWGWVRPDPDILSASLWKAASVHSHLGELTWEGQCRDWYRDPEDPSRWSEIQSNSVRGPQGGETGLILELQGAGIDVSDPANLRRIHEIYQLIEETAQAIDQPALATASAARSEEQEARPVAAGPVSRIQSISPGFWTSVAFRLAFGLWLWASGLALLLAWRWWHRPRRPLCAHCKTAIGQTVSLSCPHCGMDVREAGILTRRLHYAGQGLGQALIWAAICLLIAAWPLRTLGNCLARYTMHVYESAAVDLSVLVLGFVLWLAGLWGMLRQRDRRRMLSAEPARQETDTHN